MYAQEYQSQAYENQPRIKEKKISEFKVIRNKKKINKKQIVGNTTCSVVLFITSILFLNTCADMIYKQKEIEKLTMQIREVKSSAASLKSIMSDDLYLEDIRNKAMKNLGMIEPQDHQVMFINLPKQANIEYLE